MLSPQPTVNLLGDVSPGKREASSDESKQAKEFLFVHSSPISPTDLLVQGGQFYDNTEPTSVNELLKTFLTSGFQATNLGRAVEVIRSMLSWRLSHEPLTDEEQTELTENADDFSWAKPEVRQRTRATIFLSFTSNMISSGLRECFVFLAKNRLVDVIVTSAGGIEEDLIKCLGDFVVGSFRERSGQSLRESGWNRIGNIYVPNENYVKFEAWINPILDQMLAEHPIWTPSAFIHRLGKEIDNPTSLYYWCYKNNIEVFCPNLTDGSIGDNLSFHHFRHSHEEPKLVLDVIQDVARINSIAMHAKKSGIIILGGGTPKHHICNANLMRNGADFAAYISTSQEYDGCDSGAAPDEAISWGKIKPQAKHVKCFCDATIAFPLVTVSVFKDEKRRRQQENEILCKEKFQPYNTYSQSSDSPFPYILHSPFFK